ncbi:MAG TPA: DNA methyltransferase [Holophagaceae bacterium]|nr:DNA methyltransferase [Holophagaceae bacterium]
MNPTRPILRYHGGKWKLAPWIIAHLPAHRTYVEPFGGAASVLLRKPRSYAEIYNDLDGEVVNLFRVARDHGDELTRMLSLTPFAREEFKLSYELSNDPLEQARRTVVRSAMGFGTSSLGKVTGFRASSTRNGQTPANDLRFFPFALMPIIERLKGVTIENRDALEVMRAHDSLETAHYVDPPYVASTRDKGRDYRHEMVDADHIRLAEFLRTLKGFVILSGYESPLYADLFPGWRRTFRNTKADAAGDRMEVLWLSPNVPGAGLFEAG